MVDSFVFPLSGCSKYALSHQIQHGWKANKNIQCFVSFVWKSCFCAVAKSPPPLFHTWNVVTTFQWISCYTRAVAVVGSSRMGLVKKFQSMLYYTLDSRVPVFFMTMGENRKCQHMFWLTLKMVRGDWAERDNQRGSKVEEVCSKHLSNL